MNYLIHATPIHPSLCLQYLILLFIIATITAFILLLLLLFHYYHHYKTVATDKPLWASLFLGAAELTTHLSRLINILWLPLCRINKFGFYFPRRLLRSPILVGHQVLKKMTCHSLMQSLPKLIQELWNLIGKILFGTPWRQTMRAMYKTTNWITLYMVFTGINVSPWSGGPQSSKWYHALFLVFGNPVLKFMPISSHFHSGIGKG
jgi:hypothetical protein